jgi:hypothetical protein
VVVSVVDDSDIEFDDGDNGWRPNGEDFLVVKNCSSELSPIVTMYF